MKEHLAPSEYGKAAGHAAIVMDDLLHDAQWASQLIMTSRVLRDLHEEYASYAPAQMPRDLESLAYRARKILTNIDEIHEQMIVIRDVAAREAARSYDA